MRILILGRPDREEHLRLVEAGRAAGHDVRVARLADLVLDVSDGTASVALDGEDAVAAFDVFFFRQVHPHVGTAMLLARLAAASGKRVVDPKLADGDYVQSKAFDLAVLATADVPVPRTFHPGSRDAAKSLAAGMRVPFIMKGIHGSKGERVHLCESTEDAVALVDAYEEGGVLLQNRIDGAEEFRVLVSAGRAIGAARKRPAAGEFRANAAHGATFEAAELPDAALRTAERAADATGHWFSGVDLLIGADGAVTVLEANGAPGFAEYEQATGTDVAALIIAGLSQ